MLVHKDEIRKRLSDIDSLGAVNLYARTKRWGLPFSGGWAEQPAWVLHILDTLEQIEIEHAAGRIKS